MSRCVHTRRSTPAASAASNRPTTDLARTVSSDEREASFTMVDECEACFTLATAPVDRRPAAPGFAALAITWRRLIGDPLRPASPRLRSPGAG
jgi:hypothetical protein